ncbi:pyroglutamylated RF-amide peptide receptor-like [Montipora capricornis]|uniref:pyroglutamylated RF-amide peptide receptor-like n=1 Tax=Montipora capricornis TaxID=246305 RepID=UPI0035F1879D
MVYGSNFSNQTTECVSYVSTKAERNIKLTAYVLVLLIALTGNILVLYVISQTKHVQRNVNFLIVNMVVSDLVIPVFVLPRHIAEILLDAETQWILTGLAGKISCKVFTLLQDASMAVSVQTVVLIGCERLVAVVFPLRVKMITARLRMSLIASTWIVSAAVFAPYLYVFKLTSSSECIQSWAPAFEEPKTSKIYTTFLCVFLMIIPFSLMSVIYAVIVWTLVREKQFLKHVTQGAVYRDKLNRNVLRMALTVMTMFVICWAPSNVFIFIVIFVWNYEVPVCEQNLERFRFAAVFLSYANSAVNPCIYFAFVKHYRRCIGTAVRNSFLRMSIQSAGKRFTFRRETFELTSLSGDKQYNSESNCNVAEIQLVSSKRLRET